MIAGLRQLCGYTLIAVGLVAMPLPVVPGIPLLLAGAALLGRDHRLVRAFRGWMDRRFRANREADTR